MTLAMTGREIRTALDEAGVLPSKQLGQNFLVDPNMARWIVSQLELEPADAVVEIGPGTGSLTSHLVGKVRRVILIEFDARLAAALIKKHAGDSTIEVHHADGAKFDYRKLFKHRPLKFLGNLPYSCGGAIMKNLLGRPNPFCRAVIMLQKEVVDRLSARPGTKDYGILSLRTQANWEVFPLRTVPPEAFFPQPKIDSSVAVLIPRVSGLPPFNYRLFDELVRRGFSQRRKQLRKQLPEGLDWQDITISLQVLPTVRAEELTLNQWVDLALAFDPNPLKNLPQNAGEIFDVVDDDDRVIRTSTREEVHSNQLKHRAVHVFIFNKRGDLLLQKRSLLKDNCPGLWDSSVSGHLDAGEDYLTAATREIQEEMGLPGDILLDEIGKISPRFETGWEHVRLFRCRFDGNIAFPAAEVETAMWMPLDEISSWISQNSTDFAPGFIECWKEYIKTAP